MTATWNFGSIEKVVLMGSGSHLTRILDDLHGDKEVLVITSSRLEDVPTHVPSHTLSSFVADRGVPYEVTSDVEDSRVIREHAAEEGVLGISLGAPWILSEEVIRAFGGNLINGHGRRLPQDRGGGGFSWNILRGNRLGYSAYHLMTEEVDLGPILRMREYTFPPSCKIPRDFLEHAKDDMYDLLTEILEDIDAGETFELVSQPRHLSTYWPRLNTDVHGFVDWSWSVEEIKRFVDAFDEPYAGASTFHDGDSVRLRKASTETTDGSFHPFQAGIVYRKTDGRLFVAADGGTLIVEEVLKEEEPCQDDIRVGDRFYTPEEHLESARRNRVRYDPKGLVLDDPEGG